MTTSIYVGIPELDEHFARAQEHVNERCNPLREIGTSQESDFFDEHLPGGWILLPSRDWFFNHAVWIHKVEHKVLFLNGRALTLTTARDAITWDAELDVCFRDFELPDEDDERFDYVDRSLLYEDPDRQVRVDVVSTDADGTQATILSVKLEEHIWLSVWLAVGAEYADTLRRWPSEHVVSLFLNARRAVHQRSPRGGDPRADMVVRIDERVALSQWQLQLRFGPTGLEIAKAREQLEQLRRRLPEASVEERPELEKRVQVLTARAEVFLSRPQPFSGERPIFHGPDHPRRIAAQLVDESRA